jgi:mono/diheme cytochrome c family protein
MIGLSFRRAAGAMVLLLLAAVDAPAADVGDPARGLDYARVYCAECHGVEPDEMISPFSEVPAFREIANTPGVSELALRSFFQTTHPTMPDIIVPSADARDLIAYFLSLRR